MGISNAFVDLGPLRSSPAFRRLWIGRSFSEFGGQMTLIAVMYQVWQMTSSTVWTGAVGIARTIPLVAFGLFAGSLTDRSDRRRVYMVTTTGQAACSVLLAVQGLLGHVPVLGVLALVATQACFGAGGAPAFRTFIPRLLPARQVAAGLALNRIAFQAAMLVGPAIGGLILGWRGVGVCYLIDATTFVFAFSGAFGLPTMRPEGKPARSGLRGVVDGLSFLLRHPAVRGALLTDLATTVLSFPISVFPLINAERFDNDPRTLGLFLTAIAAGGVIASIFSGAFTRSTRPGAVMLAGSAVWGAALALFALTLNPWLALSFLVLAGAADTVSVVSRSTIVQLHTPDELRGRVAAAEQIVGQAGPDVGNMRSGLIAHATSSGAALVSGGLLCVAAVALIGLKTPGLRRFSTHTCLRDGVDPAQTALAVEMSGPSAA
jgi:MFS family permease